MPAVIAIYSVIMFVLSFRDYMGICIDMGMDIKDGISAMNIMLIAMNMCEKQ